MKGGGPQEIPTCSHPGCRSQGSFGDGRLYYCRMHLPAGFLPSDRQAQRAMQVVAEHTTERGLPVPEPKPKQGSLL